MDRIPDRREVGSDFDVAHTGKHPSLGFRGKHFSIASILLNLLVAIQWPLNGHKHTYRRTL